jgi:hypothetical protein
LQHFVDRDDERTVAGESDDVDVKRTFSPAASQR